MEVNCQSVDLAKTNAFSEVFLDYISKKESLRPFYSQFPAIENFQQLIADKSFPATSRSILVETLETQYAYIKNPPDFSSLLDEKTFTVTTGHQLNSFTGPLYVIYKIVTTVRLANELKAAYPEYNFVPIYWMASEDHDFEEISVFNLFGQKYTWETKQTGAVGRMYPVELKEIIKRLPESVPVFEQAYLESRTLADAVRAYMHTLFGESGLITIDADSRTLKPLFKDVIKDDLYNQSAVQAVNETSMKLEELGYKTQIHPREINFFYLADGIRERIIKTADGFEVNNTKLRFSTGEIDALIENDPEKFSPNVVLRPLYQEMILPNLAYIGGPSEVPYWLQLKGLFATYDVPFPALIPRNFALVVDKSAKQKLDRLDISAEDLFTKEVKLRRDFVKGKSANSLSLAEEVAKIKATFSAISKKATAIDVTMTAAVGAEETRMLKSFAKLEKKLMKAEERNFDTSVAQLLALREKLFPGGSLQERKENFLNFYLNDPQFLDKLFKAFDPLDFKFYILYV